MKDTKLNIKEKALHELKLLNNSVYNLFETLQRMKKEGFPSSVYENIYGEMSALEKTRKSLMTLLFEPTDSSETKEEYTSPLIKDLPKHLLDQIDNAYSVDFKWFWGRKTLDETLEFFSKQKSNVGIVVYDLLKSYKAEINRLN